MGLNELMNMVYDFGKYTSFNLCFPEKPFLLCYDL